MGIRFYLNRYPERQEELEEKARRMRREAANKRTDPEQMEIPA